MTNTEDTLGNEVEYGDKVAVPNVYVRGIRTGYCYGHTDINMRWSRLNQEEMDVFISHGGKRHEQCDYVKTFRCLNLSKVDK